MALVRDSNPRDGIDHMLRCVEVLNNVIARVPNDKWSSQTCCTAWTARDCASHAIGVVVNFHARATGGSTVDINDGTWADPSPAESSQRHVDRLLHIIGDVDPTAIFSHPLFGDISYDEFFGSLAYDSLIHAWDIADATGVDHRIDDSLAIAATARSAHLMHHVRSDDYVFNPACGNSPLNRLVESTGRTPVNGW